MRLNKFVKLLPLITLLATGLFLRFYNLGYSDYQGDEIKALFIPEPGQSVSEFLLTQRKGPIQFFITYLLKLVDPAYSYRFLIRAPFALAGLLSVLFFYKLICLHYNKRVALFASLFFSFNGFFVAFSRIVQYQSFVILFMILALYYFTLSIKEKSWEYKGLYAGFIFWALSILSHYDGVFIFPFAAYLLFLWLKEHRKDVKHLIISASIFVVLLLSFYIPFVLSVSSNTMSYWQGRLEGTGGKISSSTNLFSVYQPIYVLHIYFALGFFGGLIIFYETLFSGIIYKLASKTAPLLSKIGITLSPNTNFMRNSALMAWFFVAFIFFEVIVSIPGTHIYNYLVPVFVILAVGLDTAGSLVYKILKCLSLKIVYIVMISILFIFLFLQANTIFVDHKEEYPWEQEYFLAWPLPKPNHLYHLSMFGFPYFRNWEGIGDLIEATRNGTEYYSTNERVSIARYHVDLKKDTNRAGYYVFIKNPQSFTDERISEKALYWMDRYEPVFSFIKDGKEVASVYNMESGGIEEIILKGF